MRKESYKNRSVAEPQLIRRLREVKECKDRGVDASHAEKRVKEVLGDKAEVSAALVWLSELEMKQKFFEIHQERLNYLVEMSKRTDLTISEGRQLTRESIKVLELHRKFQEGAK